MKHYKPEDIRAVCDIKSHQLNKLRSFLPPYSNQVTSQGKAATYSYKELIFFKMLVYLWKRVGLKEFILSKISQIIYDFCIESQNDVIVNTSMLIDLDNIELVKVGFIKKCNKIDVPEDIGNFLIVSFDVLTSELENYFKNNHQLDLI